MCKMQVQLQGVMIPDVQTILTVAGLSSVLAYTLTDVAKVCILNFLKGKTEGKGDSVWWQQGLRLFAVVVGGSTGHFLSAWPWGAVIGACGGALCTVLVRVIKKRLRKLAG